MRVVEHGPGCDPELVVAATAVMLLAGFQPPGAARPAAQAPDTIGPAKPLDVETPTLFGPECRDKSTQLRVNRGEQDGLDEGREVGSRVVQRCLVIWQLLHGVR